MQDWIENQYINLFLYVPFLMAAGAGIYFSLPFEPGVICPGLVAVIFAIISLVKKVPIILRAILIAGFGFCYAMAFTDFINTPVIKSNLHNLDIIGTVKAIDVTENKSRIYLNVNAGDIKAGTGNAIIRVSVNNDVALAQVGDRIKANVGLFKPTAAYAPETFDYARWAYFNKLTATGYINSIEVIEHTKNTNVNSLRNTVHNRTESFLVDSLVLGYKNAIPSDDAKIWTISGIGHVWSISGFHMTLVGGWLFIVFYFIFRLIPYVTRRIPAKIPALGCAWCGLLFYLFLSGIDVATIRAFLMTTLIFVAFIFGRSVISVRNVAIAFCLIFLINPHYVMQAGFQLSFAAVFGLVWVYSDINPKMPNNKLLKILWGAILTSIVATIWTAPFVAAHFGAIPIYGLVGNLGLLPLFSFLIMPLVIVGMLTTFLGFHHPIDWAHEIYDFTLDGARFISELPYANLTVPHIPNNAIICFVIAFVGLVCIRTIKLKINYIFCGLFICIGIILVHTNSTPIFLATSDNELVAGVGDDGKLEFNKSRASNHYFAFDTWKKLNGEDANTPNKRRKHEQGIFKYGNIVYVQKFVPLMKNIKSLCNDDSIKYIVSYFDIKSESCAHKILHGGFVIYPDDHIKYMPRNRRWN